VADLPLDTESESRQRFLRDLAPYSRTLGVWSDSPDALYDELHAHLAGDPIPVGVGRFVACANGRVPDKAYRERRTRLLGTAPVASALAAAGRLERLSPHDLASRYFPELALARPAVDKLISQREGSSAKLSGFDGIAVDECQDLTPIEALLIAEIGAQVKRAPLLLAAWKQHQPLKTLQHRIAQIPGHAHALIDALIQSHIEFPGDLMEPVPV
jgi:hypothetical protein